MIWRWTEENIFLKYNIEQIFLVIYIPLSRTMKIWKLKIIENQEGKNEIRAKEPNISIHWGITIRK